MEQPIEVLITTEDYDASVVFAEQMAPVKARLWNVPEQKAYLDSLGGKLGEWAVYRAFEPDMKAPPDGFIKGSYRWRDDLSFKDGRIVHVKNQEAASAKKYGAAYMFGSGFRRDKKVMDGEPSKDLVAFCFRSEDRVILIEAITPLSLIRDGGLLSDEGVIGKWKGQKQRVALDDVLDFGQRFWIEENLITAARKVEREQRLY